MERLTDRQLEVALLLARGFTHAESAAKLGISPQAINDQVPVIKRKLGVDKPRMFARALVDQKYAALEEVIA